MRRLLSALRITVCLAILGLAGAVVLVGGWFAGVQANTLHATGRFWPTAQQRNGDNDGDRFENKLLQAFADELDEADDVEDEDRDAAMEILREADPILSRIRRQNKEALKRVSPYGTERNPQQPPGKK